MYLQFLLKIIYIKKAYNYLDDDVYETNLYIVPYNLPNKILGINKNIITFTSKKNTFEYIKIKKNGEITLGNNNLCVSKINNLLIKYYFDNICKSKKFYLEKIDNYYLIKNNNDKFNSKCITIDYTKRIRLKKCVKINTQKFLLIKQ